MDKVRSVGCGNKSGRQRIVYALVIVLLIFGRGVLAQQNPVRKYTIAEGTAFVPDVVIVKLLSAQSRKPGSVGDGHLLDINQVAEKVGIHKIDEVKYRKTTPSTGIAGQEIKSKYLDGIYKLSLSNGQQVQDVINQLLGFEEVLYAEPLYIERPLLIPDDTNIGLQDHLGVIKAYEAWDVTQGEESIIIGIVDTGAQLDHPDLENNIQLNEKDPINGIDDDGNGYLDDYRGWDFADRDNDPSADLSAHGTRVSGVSSASTNNSLGVAGVGYQSKMVPLKIFQSSNGISNNSYEAIIYAADQGFEVVNLSWGSAGTFSQFNQDIINYAALEKDVVIVAAAGNTNAELQFYPASYDHVVSVGASDVGDNKAAFATYSYSIDLIAPGASVYSTSNGDGFDAQQGSSFASPQVAGAAALVRAVFPDLNALQVGEQLRITSDDVYAVGSNSNYTGQLGKGRLNVFRAVSESNTKSIRIQKYTHADAFGEFAFFDDTVTLTMDLTNYLRPTIDATANLTSQSQYVSILNPTVNLGAMQELGTANDIKTKVYLSSNTPPGERIIFRMDFSDGVYSDYQHLEFTTNPDYLEMATAKVKMTVSSEGNLGFADDSLRNGVGFQYNGQVRATHIGFMVGNHQDSVSDNVINNYQFNSQDRDFMTVQNIRYYGNTIADQYSRSTFNDTPANATALGLIVEQEVMTWSDTQNENYIVFEFRVINTTNKQKDNLHFGLFADWDVGTASANKAAWDSSSKLGYVHNHPTQNEFGGVALLSAQQPIFHGVDIDDSNGNTDEIVGTFSDQLKHNFLTTEKLTAGDVGDGNNVGALVTANIGTLGANQSAKVAFAMIAGGSLTELQNSAALAQSKYNEFILSPPIHHFDTVCVNQAFVLSIPDGNNFEVYSDALMTNLVATGNNLNFSGVAKDTTYYIRNIDQSYAGDILRMQVMVSDPKPNFTVETDTLLLGDSEFNEIQFTDSSEDAISWTWNFGNGLFSTLQNPKGRFDTAGTYNVLLTVTSSRGCTGQVSKSILVAERSPAPELSNRTVCKGDVVNLAATNTNILRLYRNAGDQTHLAEGASVNVGPIQMDTMVYVSSAEGIFESARIPVEIKIDPINAGFTYGPDTTSLTSDRIISLKDLSSNASTYVWIIDETTISTTQLASFEFIDEQSLVAKQVVGNTLGCKDSVTTIINISESQIPTVNNLSVCKFGGAEIRPGNGNVFNFYSDQNLENLIGKGSQFEFKSLARDTVLYITGADGLRRSDGVEVIVSLIPFEVDIAADPDTLVLADGINARFFSNNEEITSWQWSIDGQDYLETFESPTFLFDTAGVYKIQLIASNAVGCRDTTRANYVVLDVITSINGALDDLMSVYPNPASSNLIIRMERSMPFDELVFYNVMGGEVMVVPMKPGTTEIDVSSLSNGLYFIKNAGPRELISKKIIVRK